MSDHAEPEGMTVERFERDFCPSSDEAAYVFLSAFRAAVARAVAEERERCARVAEKDYRTRPDSIHRDYTAERACSIVSERIAASIRARGGEA